MICNQLFINCLDVWFTGFNLVSHVGSSMIEHIFDAMEGAKVFSKLDALSGYHQVNMDPEDIEKTAFGCKFDTFEFLKMPFGLVNGPATSQRAMDRSLKNVL